jgi:hypothetical protein
VKPLPILLGAGVIVAGAGAAVASSARRVGFIEHATGVHPALRGLLGEWNRVGGHTVVVAPGDVASWPYPGGVRTDEAGQVAAAGAGLSKATTLRDTAHGRGAALDVWPDGFDPHRGFDTQPGLEHLFRVFGEWAEAQSVQVGGDVWNFTWGGRWKKPDLPHVEIFGWRSLPFPPPFYGEGFA